MEKTLVRVFLGSFLFTYALVLHTPAQEPIRVETTQVLVPVLVIDKDRNHRLFEEGKIFDVLPGEKDAAAQATLIHGLTVADFRVLDDGKEQAVQSVTEEQSFYWDVRDNRGYHTEYIGPGGGKWSTTQWAPGILPPLGAARHYVVAYARPESAAGSCHEIKVSVRGRNAFVTARSEYCNNERSPFDPVYGTAFGKQLEAVQALDSKNTVNVSLAALPLDRKGNDVRVHIVVEWPWERLKQGHGATEGVLGMIFDKQSNLVTRFSDLAYQEGVPCPRCYGPLIGTENRYEKQLDLPSGEYMLRVILGDGKRFGWAEIPLIVEGYDGKELAVSAPSLCRQIDDFSSYGHASVLPGTWTAKLPDSYVPLISKGVQFKPTASTGFRKGESLYTYFEVYEPLLAEASPVSVEIQLRVVDTKSGDDVTAPESISTTQYVTTGSPVIPIGRGIDIGNLPKGSYRLDVKATDSAGKSTAWRSANFTVE